MKTIFKKILIQNFKNHENVEIEFGDRETAITGENGEGKTGIGESITWILYGVDMMGAKFDPTPVNGEGRTKVELLLNVDGRDLLLGKELANSAKYFINEIPEKATKFDGVVAGLFDKNLFLSIFSPSYFFSQHWQEQRSQLLRYVSEPLNKEVLEDLNKISRERLEQRLKKNSLEDIEKIYKPQIKTKETEYQRAAERFLTLKERHDKESEDLQEVDPEKIKNEMAEIKQKVIQAKEDNQKFQERQKEYNKMEHDVELVKKSVNNIAGLVRELMAMPIKDTCETCGQALQGDALEKVKNSHVQKLESQKQTGAEYLKQFKELQKKLDEFTVAGGFTDVTELQERYFQLQNDLTSADRIGKLAEEVKKAEENKETVRLELGEARGVVDSIKDFATKKSELMVEKVNSLMDQLSVKLFDEKKNGSINPTFEVEMDGKPYRKLSTAEKIKAGLELAEVLIKQSEQSIPVFVDNAESILKFIEPSAQLITARVKAGKLKIQTKGAAE